MNYIAKLLSFVRVVKNGANVSDVTIDTGGGNNNTAEHFAPPGDDSFPLKTDYALAASIPRGAGKVVTGYIDPINTPVAQEGDKRVYARNPADGSPVNQVWLKNDGSVLISNDNGSVLLRADGGSIVTTPNSTLDAKADGSIKGANGSGSFELKTSGDMDINGCVIDATGNINCPGTIVATTSVSAPTIAATGAGGSLTVAGKEMKGHTHTQGNDSAGNTEQNTGGPV